MGNKQAHTAIAQYEPVFIAYLIGLTRVPKIWYCLCTQIPMRQKYNAKVGRNRQRRFPLDGCGFFAFGG